MTSSTRSTTAIAFALTPGLLHTDDIIDLNSKLGRDIYTRATASLKTFFDGDSKNINLFQNQLKRKTENAGWGTGTGDIIHIRDSKGNSRNLITEYGCLTKDDIEAAAAKYLGKPKRAAQNNQMMLECILGSITEECFHKIANEEEKYTHQDHESAALLYKLLMSKAVVDTRATTFQFRHYLDTLDEYMINVGSNIELFNMHVKNVKEGLKARGEIIDDLPLKLFKGYRATSDCKFVEYIEKKEEEYMDGKDMDEDLLMQLALNKYAIRKQNNTWGAPSAEQEQLTALTSEIKKLKEDKRSPRAETSQDKRKLRRAAFDEQAWAWKKVPPATGEPDSKIVKSKTYHWCIPHQAWCLHTTSECELKLREAKKENTRKGPAKRTTSKAREAMKAILDTVNDESDDESTNFSDEE